MTQGISAEFIQTILGERILVTRFTKDDKGRTENTEFVSLTREESKGLIDCLLHLLLDTLPQAVAPSKDLPWVPKTADEKDDQ